MPEPDGLDCRSLSTALHHLWEICPFVGEICVSCFGSAQLSGVKDTSRRGVLIINVIYSFKNV